MNEAKRNPSSFLRTIWPKGPHPVFFLIAFALFDVEHYNVFNNIAVIKLFSDHDWMRSTGLNLFSIVVTCCGFLVLMFLFRKKRYAMSDFKGLAVVCVVIFCVPILWWLSRFVFHSEALGYVGFALFAFGHLCFLPSIVKNLAVVGPRHALVIYAFAMVIEALVEPFIGNMPPLALDVLIAITPIGLLASLQGATKTAPVAIVLKRDSKTKIPKVLVGTLIVTGMLSGVYADMGVRGWEGVPVPASIAESVLAGAVIVFFLASSRLNYNRIIYLIGIPLMVYGVLLLTTETLPQELTGFLVFQFGYDFLYAGLWSLYSYLIRYSTFNYYWLAISAAFGTFFGRSISIFSIEILKAFPELTAYLNLFVLTVLFGAMVAAIMFYGQNNMKSGWGSIKPQDDFLSSDVHERNYSAIAAMSELTPREKDVLRLLSKGNNAKSISEKLCISPGTAKTHVKHVYGKLGVHSQQELIDMVEQNEMQLQEK